MATATIDPIGIPNPALASALERERLSSSSANAAFSSSSSSSAPPADGDDVRIPTIDMSYFVDDESRDVAMEMLWDAAQNVGFFNVVNHGITREDIDAVFRASRDFFELDAEEKARCPFDAGRNSGYEYMTQAPPSTIAAGGGGGVADQKESMQMTAREGCMDGLWPDRPDGFRDTAERAMRSCHGLACRILSLLESRACPHLEPGTLAASHNLWSADGQCTLRLLHYPPVDERILEAENLWRAGAHTDWGCITLLFQRVGEEGLECRADPGGDDARWTEVPPAEDDGITVNVGDMLRLWSDGRLVSNMHRVRMPRDAGECQRSRHSVAFFLQADGGAVIDGANGTTITAGEYFAGRINSNFSE